MRDRICWLKIMLKSLIRSNRGNTIFLICLTLLLLIPTVQMIINRSIMAQVETAHAMTFGQFTDIYYISESEERSSLNLSEDELDGLLPGFHLESFGLVSTVYREALDDTSILRLGSIDEIAFDSACITLISGRMPETDNEVALTTSISERFDNPKIGSTVALNGRTYTVCGIMPDYGYLWPKNPQHDQEAPANALVSQAEARRILSTTQTLSQQILITRQPGISNPTEGNSNFLRNTNNAVDSQNLFRVPATFLVLMVLTTLTAMLMILLLNQKLLTRRVRHYHLAGLNHKAVLFMIRCELIVLSTAGSLLGSGLGIAAAAAILSRLSGSYPEPIPLSISVQSVLLLSGSVLGALVLMALIYPGIIIRKALADSSEKTCNLHRLATRFNFTTFDLKCHKPHLTMMLGCVMIIFCLLSLGLFYGSQLHRNNDQLQDFYLEKDYDFLFYADLPPAEQNSGEEAAVFWTTNYESIGAQDDLLRDLAALPVVSEVKAYQEINKLQVLISQDQVDDYIDGQDFIRDGRYSPMLQTGLINMDFIREHFEYADDAVLVGAEVLAYPLQDLTDFSRMLSEGKINLEKIEAGEEVILKVPAYTLDTAGDGAKCMASVSSTQPEAINSTTFEVGDTIQLTGIFCTEDLNGPILASQSDCLVRRDLTVRIGAIVRDESGLLPHTGSTGKTFTVLTSNDALDHYGLDATYSNVLVYTNPSASPTEAKQMIMNLSPRVPSMVIDDVQAKIQSLKTYNSSLNLFVISLLVILSAAGLIVMTSLLMVKTRLSMTWLSLLRINGLPLHRYRRNWTILTLLVVAAGCLVGIPLSLVLFRLLGSFSPNAVLDQIFYYFPPENWLFVSIVILCSAFLAMIPSLIHLSRFKSDVLVGLE